MPSDFMVYRSWMNVGWDTAEQAIEAKAGQFTHLSVNSEWPIARDDTIWLVTIPPRPDRPMRPEREARGFRGDLVLVGRLVVGTITKDYGIARWSVASIGGRIGDSARGNTWIIGKPGTTEKYDAITLCDVGTELQFHGTPDHLAVGSSGVHTHEIADISRLVPSSADALRLRWVPDQYQDEADSSSLAQATESPVDYFDDPDEDTFPEGRAMLGRHLARERNKTLVRQAKERFKDLHGGRLYCEVCEFNFFEKYGVLGEDYIEAHHTRPISELRDGDRTRVCDLAMVCSNCHRMVHRRRPWLGIQELRDLLSTAAFSGSTSAE